MQALRIRPAEATDRAAIFALYTRAKHDELANEPVIPAVLALPDDPDRLASFEASTVFVPAGHAVVGFGACASGRVRMLFVDSEARGRGIGAALLAHMIETMPGAVDLDVLVSNTAALALYVRAGFQPAKAYRAVYNGVGVDVLGLRRPAASSPPATVHPRQPGVRRIALQGR